MRDAEWATQAQTVYIRTQTHSQAAQRLCEALHVLIVRVATTGRRGVTSVCSARGRRQQNDPNAVFFGLLKKLVAGRKRAHVSV